MRSLLVGRTFRRSRRAGPRSGRILESAQLRARRARGRAGSIASMPESRRMAGVQTPIIPVVAEWIRQSPGTISLGQGVVGYGPPPEALARVQGFGASPDDHKYKPVVGLPELVEAFA